VQKCDPLPRLPHLLCCSPEPSSSCECCQRCGCSWGERRCADGPSSTEWGTRQQHQHEGASQPVLGGGGRREGGMRCRLTNTCVLLHATYICAALQLCPLSCSLGPGVRTATRPLPWTHRIRTLQFQQTQTPPPSLTPMHTHLCSTPAPPPRAPPCVLTWKVCVVVVTLVMDSFW